MTSLSKSERAVLGILYTDRPRWPDHCYHGQSAYVATFESVHLDGNKKPVREEIDLYVWHGNKVCLRFGAEPAEYYSPGTIANVIRCAHNMESYANATRILLALGRVVWVQNKDSTE